MTDDGSIWGKLSKVTGLALSLSTSLRAYGFSMAFMITYQDESIEHIDADAYTSEGALTTFYRVAPGRTPRLDAWAVRCMSVRTDRVIAIRLQEEAAASSLSLVG